MWEIDKMFFVADMADSRQLKPMGFQLTMT